MSFDEIKNLFEDEVIMDLLSELQSKVGNGIYFIEDVYYEGNESGEVDEVSAEDLGDLEEHLQPRSNNESYEITTFNGEIKVNVDVVNEEGKRVENKVPLKVDFESEEGIDFGEYFGDFIEESFQLFRDEYKGIWLESDGGDFKEHKSLLNNEFTQVFIVDDVLFVEDLISRNSSKYESVESIKEQGVGSLMKDIEEKTNAKKVVINSFKIKINEINNFNLNNNFVHISYFVNINEGSRESKTVKKNKIIIIRGNSFEQVKNNIIKELVKINDDILEGDKVGLFTQIKEDKKGITTINLTNKSQLLSLMNEMENKEGENSYIFSRNSYDKYINLLKNNEDVYAYKQAIKYRNDNWYKGVMKRFDDVNKLSKEMQKYYDKNIQAYKFSEGNQQLIIGPTFAFYIIKGKGKQLLYNLKEDGKSIKDARKLINKAGIFKDVGILVLDIVDGRKNITKEKTDKVFK